jgi:hypothetical protein
LTKYGEAPETNPRSNFQRSGKYLIDLKLMKESEDTQDNQVRIVSFIENSFYRRS